MGTASFVLLHGKRQATGRDLACVTKKHLDLSTGKAATKDIACMVSCCASDTDLANVLMVSSSEGMLHRVERNTTHLGPLVPLGLVLVVGITSLHHGLVDTPTTRDDPNHAAASICHSFARA